MLHLNRTSLDHFIGRLLLVDVPAETPDPKSASVQKAERAFGFSLVFSGVRCILQYAVLPFLLPMIGVAADAALPLMLVISVAAVISIFFSLRRFWRIRYAHRWHYLGVAVAALVILTAFIILDVTTLLAG